MVAMACLTPCDPCRRRRRRRRTSKFLMRASKYPAVHEMNRHGDAIPPRVVEERVLNVRLNGGRGARVIQ